MKVKLTPSQDSLTPHIQRVIGELPAATQRALQRAGDRFAEQAKENIGEEDVDRPKQWKDLSPRRARQTERTIATLYDTGELNDSIKSDVASSESVEVGSDCEYAYDHQFGNPENNLPARPFFPVYDSGELTPKAEAELSAIIEEELSKLL